MRQAGRRRSRRARRPRRGRATPARDAVERRENAPRYVLQVARKSAMPRFVSRRSTGLPMKLLSGVGSNAGDEHRARRPRVRSGPELGTCRQRDDDRVAVAVRGDEPPAGGHHQCRSRGARGTLGAPAAPSPRRIPVGQCHAPARSHAGCSNAGARPRRWRPTTKIAAVSRELRRLRCPRSPAAAKRALHRARRLGRGPGLPLRPPGSSPAAAARDVPARGG